MKIIDSEHNYIIEYEEGWVRFQRKHEMSAMDNPMSPDENLICAFCVRILELEEANNNTD